MDTISLLYGTMFRANVGSFCCVKVQHLRTGARGEYHTSQGLFDQYTVHPELQLSVVAQPYRSIVASSGVGVLRTLSGLRCAQSLRVLFFGLVLVRAGSYGHDE